MTDPGTTTPSSPIRVAIQQPALAKYRVPVFRSLAERPGIDLKVFYGEEPGIPNAPADGFAAELAPLSVRRLLGQIVLRHPVQWRLAGSDDYDVVILSWNIRYVSLVPALLRARLRKKPVILWGHGYSKSDSGVRKQLRNGVGSLAAAWLFYDRRTAAAAVEGGYPAEGVFAAPNTLDQTPIQTARAACLEDAAAMDSFRREQALEGKQVLLYVSRLTPPNRLDLLIESLPRVLSKQPETVVALVGKGEEEHTRLADRAERLGVQQHVRFLGPIYEEPRLAPWFLSASAFVYPANIGLSLLHAFGYGLPVVTSDKTEAQNPEIVALEPGVNGLTYRDGDAGDLADQLLTLLGDKPLRERLGAAAHATATG
ncbi:MAG: glycosyltransferase family 4 protein, partial [Planctomycetota bacterium]